MTRCSMTKVDYRFLVLALVITLAFVRSSAAKSYEYETHIAPYFGADPAAYDAGIPSPSVHLGESFTSKETRYDDVVSYMHALAESTPRVSIHESGATYEGRKLYYLVVSSEENMAHLDAIKDRIRKISYPERPYGGAELDQLFSEQPAVAWLGYSIHGDELSGTEASMLVAYQLAAGNDERTRKLREDLMVVIDPCENPDGRERCLSYLEIYGSKSPTYDVQALQRGGAWGGGRGNHFLFDLNRDWISLVHPETRARIRTILEWRPQLVVDAHEMWPTATFLFSPPREPINSRVPKNVREWWPLFSGDQAKAFDEYGWDFYRGDWNEEWFPGYGSIWFSFYGAVGILYEQAGATGDPVKVPGGRILTYAEAIHHQFVSSIANLTTLSDNREEILRKFYRNNVAAVSDFDTDDMRAVFLLQGDNPARTDRLVGNLIEQGIEVGRTTQPVRQSNLTGRHFDTASSMEIPAGSFVISLDQPARNLIHVLLDFDIRMSEDVLRDERRHLEKFGETRMYEVSAWSLPLAYNVETYWSKSSFSGDVEPVSEMPTAVGGVDDPDAKYGFIFDTRSDESMRALKKLFDLGVSMYGTDKPTATEEREFPRGCVLIRRNNNPDSLVEILKEVASKTGVRIFGLQSAGSHSGSDFGADRFPLLKKPRVAIFTKNPLSWSMGTAWHLLDTELEMSHTLLDISGLPWYDLSRYNVIILPSAWGGHNRLKHAIGDRGKDKLQKWVNDGGTLICIEQSAAWAADTSVGLSSVALQRQSLADLDELAEDIELEKQSEAPPLDYKALWNPPDSPPEPDSEHRSAGKADIKALKKKDERARLFQPRGVILSTRADTERWLSYGAGDEIPVLVYSNYAFRSAGKVETPVRYEAYKNLRLSGLLWPEARERWAETAYATREQKGKGQIIMFATDPMYRGYFHGSGRLLLNAILFGPGFGTSAVEDY